MEAKFGDIIRCVSSDRFRFKEGDVGTVIDDTFEEEGGMNVDFNGHGNAHVASEGIWWVRHEEYEIVKEK